MTRYKQFLPRKVEFARDALVTLIHDRNLQSGDRLPTYTALRNELGLGSQTIAGAVGLLCEAGVLEVRDKVGIFVKNPAGNISASQAHEVGIRGKKDNVLEAVWKVPSSRRTLMSWGFTLGDFLLTDPLRT